MKQKLTKNLKEMADLISKHSGIYRNYSDKDLKNAIIVLTEVLFAKTYDYHKDKITQEQMLMLKKELDKSLHQTVRIFSRVNLHNI